MFRRKWKGRRGWSLDEKEKKDYWRNNNGRTVILKSIVWKEQTISQHSMQSWKVITWRISHAVETQTIPERNHILSKKDLWDSRMEKAKKNKVAKKCGRKLSSSEANAVKKPSHGPVKKVQRSPLRVFLLSILLQLKYEEVNI